MKKNSRNLVLLGAIAIGTLLFLQTTPISFADDESCSGINSWSCLTGRPGIVGAGPSGPGGYYVNDPTPGGVCSCSGCWCGSSPRPSVTSSRQTGVKSEVDIGTIPKKTTGGTQTGGSAVGGSPTDRVVSTIKILVNTASTCDSACRAAHNQPEWDKFYTGFYDIPVSNNVVAATTNSSCVGMGCNVTDASVTRINPVVDVFYKGIYPIRSLTESSGPGTKTISQQEFDAKYGSYIQR